MPDPLPITDAISIPPGALSVRAVRSSGPGGQNVNKVSSKIELRVDLAAILGLPEDARARLLSLAANRLDAEGWLVMTSQKTRDQPRNLADAREKVKELVLRALHRPKKRRPTRATRSSQDKRIAGKKKRGAHKRGRGAVTADD